MKTLNETPDSRLHCFRHVFAQSGCHCYGHRFATLEGVHQQATHGGATCNKCGKRSDLRKALEHFNALGQPEALFGLDFLTLNKKIPATQTAQVTIIDLGLSLPYEAEIVYAHVAPQGLELDEAPWLLAPQEMHQPWPLVMRLYVPPGPERAVLISFALKPKSGLPYALEVALQGVDAFHRYRYGLAALLLAAAVEAILRPLCESVYATRGVPLPSDVAFAALVERARLLFEPQLGSQIVGNLRELAKEGRNPHAHGRASKLSREQVAMWMVDVATLYEWSRVATPLNALSTPLPTAQITPIPEPDASAGETET